MTEITLGEFLERMLPIEDAMARMFAALARRLPAHPALAAALRDLEGEERAHLEVIRAFRDGRTPEVLSNRCEAAAVRQLERVADLLEGDPIGRFSDFQEAYEFIHELENGEVAPMIRLLRRECAAWDVDASALGAVVEPHLARVVGLAETAGDRAHRRAIRL